MVSGLVERGEQRVRPRSEALVGVQGRIGVGVVHGLGRRDRPEGAAGVAREDLHRRAGRCGRAEQHTGAARGHPARARTGQRREALDRVAVGIERVLRALPLAARRAADEDEALGEAAAAGQRRAGRLGPVPPGLAVGRRSEGHDLARGQPDLRTGRGQSAGLAGARGGVGQRERGGDGGQRARRDDAAGMCGGGHPVPTTFWSLAAGPVGAAVSLMTKRSFVGQWRRASFTRSSRLPGASGRCLARATMYPRRDATSPTRAGRVSRKLTTSSVRRTTFVRTCRISAGSRVVVTPVASTVGAGGSSVAGGAKSWESSTGSASGVYCGVRPSAGRAVMIPAKAGSASTAGRVPSVQ